MLYVNGCSLQACVALIHGVKWSSLKRFRFESCITQHSGLVYPVDLDVLQFSLSMSLSAVIAKAVGDNACLESLSLEVGTKAGGLPHRYVDLELDEASTSMREVSNAFAMNTSLVEIYVGTSFPATFRNGRLSEYVKRNRELRNLCFTLVQLAKPEHTFGTLNDPTVRQMVFSFFLPRDCTTARIFHIMGMVSTCSNGV